MFIYYQLVSNFLNIKIQIYTSNPTIYTNYKLNTKYLLPNLNFRFRQHFNQVNLHASIPNDK